LTKTGGHITRTRIDATRSLSQQAIGCTKAAKAASITTYTKIKRGFMKNAHTRKSGPGRYNRLRAYSRATHGDFRKHGYPDGIQADAHWSEEGNTKQLAPAKAGGNWQGKGFLSLSEHDAITLKCLEHKTQKSGVYVKALRKANEETLIAKREGR
jgi:hypothetical protein